MSAFIHWLRTTIRGSRLRVHNQSAAGPDQSQENNLAELQSTTGSHDSPAAPPALPEGVEQVVDGQVAFRDGEFLITPPVGDGLPPVLVPDDSVVLTIDGLEVSRPVSLLLGMKAEVRPRQSASSVREFHIEIAPDGMAAYLSLAALGPPGYRVRESGPARTITLVAEPLPGLQRNPTVAEIVHALHKAGVVRGIHEHEIRNALEDPGRVRVQVASGRLPTPGRPGRVKSYVDKLFDGNSYGLGVEVQPGQVLARLIPPAPGVPGFDVTGQTREPAPPRQVQLQAGFGTQLSGDGSAVAATNPGRPVLLRIEQDVYRATVVPVAKLHGPLVESKKPYRFEGDVLIEGDVGGGVTIQAGGWIWVKGSVHGATLEAGQGIWVDENVKWGRLITRTTRVQLRDFQQQMQAILADLEQMCEYARYIVDHPRYDELTRSLSFGEIMLMLAEQRFAQLHHRLHDARRAMARLRVHPATIAPEAVLNTLEHALYSGVLQSLFELTQFTDALAKASQRVVDALGAGGSDAPVHASVVFGSEIDAEGDVIVGGTGVEQTIIRTRGNVRATCLRDCRVEAGSSISAETVAASLRSALVLEVPEGGRIRIGTALTPTPVRIGNWCHILAPRTRNVEIESDGKGGVRLIRPTTRRQRRNQIAETRRT